MEGLPTASVDMLRPVRVSLTLFTPPDERRGELSRAATSTTTMTNEKPSVADTGNSATAIMPLELDDRLYESEVLGLKNGQIEESLDEGCAREALSLGVSVNQTHEAMLSCEKPTSESVVTVASSHLRSESASNGSQSTGITSHTSTDEYETRNTSEPKPRSGSRRMTLRRSFSFTEYEKFLAELKAEALFPGAGGLCPPHPPTSPAHSIYSISSKKSLFSLRHTLRRLPRFQRFQATGKAANRCKAQFCYICGSPWDPTYGCPVACNGDAELERRRIQEEERREREEEENAKREAEEQAKVFRAFEAARRSTQSRELAILRKQQVIERDVFIAFEQKQRWTMWTRHAQEKMARLGQHADTEKGIKERHLQTTATLEDQQVLAELELRQAFKQERNACLIRLRHMEAYCDAPNNTKTPPTATTTSETSTAPIRTITETNRRELTQQYTTRDTMDRTHQSRINILREKQAQQLEALVQRQEAESTKLHDKSSLELEKLERRFEEEERRFEDVFGRRKERLVRRWGVMEAILRRRLEAKEKVEFGPLPTLLWPDTESPMASSLLGQQA
ncbi:MAG: hypothetical protein M1840_004145 [Geoglossum simile]|nr:MAG: hypothetical protein M1840_004145 [Geoglossum simile]